MYLKHKHLKFVLSSSTWLNELGKRRREQSAAAPPHKSPTTGGWGCRGATGAQFERNLILRNAAL